MQGRPWGRTAFVIQNAIPANASLFLKYNPNTLFCICFIQWSYIVFNGRIWSSFLPMVLFGLMWSYVVVACFLAEITLAVSSYIVLYRHILDYMSAGK